MSPRPQILFTHPSKQGASYEWPSAARREGFETLFLTGFYYKEDEFPYSLVRFLPPGPRAAAIASLKRRRIDALDDGSVVSVCGPWLELLTRPNRFFGNLSAPFVLVQDFAYDRVASRWIASSGKLRPGGIMHGFQGSCLHSIRAAKSRGLLTVLELTLPPCQWEIIAGERRRLGLRPGRSKPRPNELAEIREADYVVSQSYFSVRCAAKLGGDEKRMIHLPLGSDLSRFTPRPRTAGEARPFQALFLGQISIRKGIHHLLEAWHDLKLPDASLVLAGSMTDPDAAPFLEKYKGCYTWKGFVSHEELPGLYQQSDLFIMPSLAEGGCNVIHEAMASGLPCIVSRNAGSAIQDGVQGRVIDAGDAEALKQAIRALREDRVLCERMGLSALERAHKFGWQDFSRRLGKMYDRIHENNGAPFPALLDLIDE